MISPVLYPPVPPVDADNEPNTKDTTVSEGVASAGSFLAPASVTFTHEALRMSKLGIMFSAKAAKTKYLDEKKAIAAKKAGPVRLVMKYLDFLRPLLLRDNSLVTVALARFEFLQSKVIFPNPPLDLQTHELSSEEEVYDFFPTARMQSFDTLITYLSFDNTILGKRVCLLDILTALVIILRGSLESKTELLFKWYNINKTGVMTEVEHIAFILRLGDSQLGTERRPLRRQRRELPAQRRQLFHRVLPCLFILRRQRLQGLQGVSERLDATRQASLLLHEPSFLPAELLQMLVHSLPYYPGRASESA